MAIKGRLLVPLSAFYIVIDGRVVCCPFRYM